MIATLLVALGVPLLNADGQSVPAAQNPVGSSVDMNRAAVSETYGKLPLSFEENQGQSDAKVRFLARGQGYSLFLSDREAVLTLRKPMKSPHKRGRLPAGPVQPASFSSQADVVRMGLDGANTDPIVRGMNRLPGVANYFIGNDSKKWRSAVPTYGQVKYTDVYPGIDLAYYGNQGKLEYDFIVAPKADPKRICLRFDGAKRLKLDASGDLEVIAKDGSITFHKPMIYQEVEGKRRPVEGEFALQARNTVGFRIAPYDTALPLVVDPFLEYSTYLGGSFEDAAEAIAIDKAGDAYVTGLSYSSDFPVTTGALQPVDNKSATAATAFVAKVNATGTGLVYATYLGGSTSDFGDAIAVDDDGDAYIAGQTQSSDFPVTTGVLEGANPNGGGVYTGFVSKLNETGSALVYSTYLGGSNPIGAAIAEQALGIALDANRDAFVVGYTASPDFPVSKGAFQSTITNFDGAGFVTGLNPTATGLIYSTFLGGSPGGSSATGVMVDGSGNAYVTGYTGSSNFPVTTGAFQSTISGTASAFVTKLNPTGTAAIYSTFLGGTSNSGEGDQANAIAVNASGEAYVTGITYSSSFPVTKGALEGTNEGGSTFGTGFVALLNSTGTSLNYATYLGGNYRTEPYGIQADSSGNAYVVGNTQSTDFPVTTGAFQSGNPTTSSFGTGFVTKLNPTGTALLYSSYFGGNNGEIAYGLALDSSLNVYLAGTTASTNFPVTTGAFQTKNHATYVATGFVSKLDLTASTAKIATTTTLTSSANPQTAGLSVTFTATVQPGSGNGVPSGTISTTVNGLAGPTLTLGSAGTATYTTSSLPVGMNTIVAMYSGDANYSPSTSATFAETIDPAQQTPAATPIFSPAVGTYATAVSVTITDATAGATIYYTTNGTTPTTTSTKYAGPITVSATETIQAIAAATGYTNSAIASGTYTILPTSTSGLRYIPVTPCRIVDTRGAAGVFGGPELGAGSSREFDIPQSGCGIPTTAVAYSLNVTVVPTASLNYLTLWPSGQAQPLVSTLNSDGRVKANAAITPAGINGGVSVYVSDATNVILDIDGYFVASGTTSALEFYPLTPCRVADTRNPSGPLGGPSLGAGSSRAFPVLSSGCHIPSTAEAYSLNVTAIPHNTLNYLTTWNTGGAQPNVSTLNAPTGAITANAAIVPAGGGGDISVFVSDAADVILDVNGYFAPPATGGLSLYAVTPCRVIDTRSGPGAFNGVFAVNVESSACAPASAAQAYVLNATVVPAGPLNYLTLWPDGEAQPNVSTLNAEDGAVTSNMAILPTANGKVDAYSSNPTNLILDISSYFAP